MANYDPYYGQDPQQSDWEAQVRQQVMAQMGGDPTVTSAPAAEPSTSSPNFASPSPTYADPSPAAAAPAASGAPNTPAAAAPAASGAPNTPAPGNDVNQISGWYDKFLGPGRAQSGAADVQAWANSGLSLSEIQNKIANSAEALQYAYNRDVRPPTTAGGGGSRSATQQTLPSSSGAYGLTNGYAAPPADTSWRDSIRQIIMNRLSADQGPVDPNSPQILAAMNASKDAYTRQNTTERDQLAERLYAQGAGLNTDAITQQIQQSNERTGTAQSNLRAQLIMSAYKDKQQELTHLLDLATQTGDTESAQKIQVTLANLQAALQREGLGVNLAEFGAQLNQNATLAGLNG